MPIGWREEASLRPAVLAGFTNEGTKDGRLLVCDLVAGKRWWSEPNGAGHQRDFYRIDLEGYDPLEVEKAFQGVEDAAAPALRRLTETETPPPFEETASELLPLIASLVIRVPTSRRVIERASERVVRATIPKALPKFPKPPPIIHSKLFGHLPPGVDPSPEEYEAAMLKFFEEEVRIDIDQTWSIAHMISRFEFVLQKIRGTFARFSGLVNALTIGGTDRYIFSAADQIHWRRNDGSFGDISDLPRCEATETEN